MIVVLIDQKSNQRCVRKGLRPLHRGHAAERSLSCAPAETLNRAIVAVPCNPSRKAKEGLGRIGGPAFIGGRPAANGGRQTHGRRAKCGSCFGEEESGMTDAIRQPPGESHKLPPWYDQYHSGRVPPEDISVARAVRTPSSARHRCHRSCDMAAVTCRT
jgi:hypothetical protein